MAGLKSYKILAFKENTAAPSLTRYHTFDERGPHLNLNFIKGFFGI